MEVSWIGEGVSVSQRSLALVRHQGFSEWGLEVDISKDPAPTPSTYIADVKLSILSPFSLPFWSSRYQNGNDWTGNDYE